MQRDSPVRVFGLLITYRTLLANALILRHAPFPSAVGIQLPYPQVQFVKQARIQQDRGLFLAAQSSWTMLQRFGKQFFALSDAFFSEGACPFLFADESDVQRMYGRNDNGFGKAVCCFDGEGSIAVRQGKDSMHVLLFRGFMQF